MLVVSEHGVHGVHGQHTSSAYTISGAWHLVVCNLVSWFTRCNILLQGLLGVSTLLAVPEYRGAVLEGLVASIGGLDASLSKEASAAFVHTLTAADTGEHIIMANTAMSQSCAQNSLVGQRLLTTLYSRYTVHGQGIACTCLTEVGFALQSASAKNATRLQRCIVIRHYLSGSKIRWTL